MTDIYHAMYTNVAKLTGKKHPTFIVVGNDNESGKNGGQGLRDRRPRAPASR